MLRGTHILKLNHGRIALPARWPPAFSGPLVLGPGDALQLVLCRADQLEQVTERMQLLALSPDEAQAHARLFVGCAVEVALDGRGRFTVPAQLREVAGLGDEVLLAGQGDWIELWVPARWHERLPQEFTLPEGMA